MYQIESAYGLSKVQGSVWKEHDVKLLTGMQLFSLFERLYITLSSTYLAEPVSIDIKSYEPLISFDGRTAEDIFGTWTDTTPLIESPTPKYRAARAVFTDARRAGYDINRSIPGSHWTSSSNDSLRTEMQVSRIGLDMRLFHKHCLITANGYFYKGEATAEVLYVPEAGKTIMSSRYNHVGVLSFENIGEITTHALKSADVYPQALAGSLWDGINTPIPEGDLTGKTLMLVCMGKLYLETDHVFNRVGNGRAVIHPNALYLHDHYAESWNKIDWKPVFGEWTKPNFINTEVAQSDGAMKGMIDHAQTFWIVLDTPHISKVILPLRGLPLPGCFISPDEPKALLIAGSGFIMEYWKRYQDGEWAVNCAGVRPGLGVRGTIGRDDWPQNLSIKNLPYATYYNIQAALMDLVADEIPDED